MSTAKSNTCFCFGHHDAPENLIPQIEAAVIDLVENDSVKNFIVGHYGEFDRMTAVVLSKMKKERFPEIRLFLLMPYPLEQQPVPLLEGFEYFCPRLSGKDPRFFIVEANRQAIDRSTHVLCFANKVGSNCQKFLFYAENALKKIKNIG